jgi:hypothetical protein
MTMSHADRVLNYWYSVEFFNSYDLDDKIKGVKKGRQPYFFASQETVADGTWATFANRKRDLYLLPFDTREATKTAQRYVDQRLSDELEEVRDAEMAAEGLTCFAKLTVSDKGKPDFDSMSFSALPWAMGRLKDDDIGNLVPESFESSVSALKRELNAWLSQQEDGILDAEGLLRVAQALVEWAGFAPEADKTWAFVDVRPADTQTMKKDDGGGAGGDDSAESASAADLPILNSFYVHDLAQAKVAMRSGKAPKALANYLAIADRKKLDLDSDAGQAHILETLRPVHGLPGRWPSAVEHVQSLMQQFALNKIRAMGEGEVLAVNGPPGTGKTTLLRDLIAHLVVERAEKLAKLPTAKDGLSGKICNVVFTKDTRKVPLLKPELTGYEIVVASTNNGAVENLTLELPQLKGVGPEYQDTLRYFQEVATKYAGSNGPKPWSQPDDVWGLVSAALGKSANRSRFAEAFQYSAARPTDVPSRRLSKDKVDFDAWRKVGAEGIWQYREQRKDGGFNAAKAVYLKARAGHDAFLRKLEVLDRLLVDLRGRQEAMRLIWPAMPDVDSFRTEQFREFLQVRIEGLLDAVAVAERRLGPSWLHWMLRFFRQEAFERWAKASDDLAFARQFSRDLVDVARLVKECDVHLWDGNSLFDKRNQQSAPWQGETYNRLRSQLFVSAMALHEAFFLEAADPQVIMAIADMQDRLPLVEGREAVWQWLFMLTPVVSSTFASIRSQFSGMGPESLGWLIVDEAGQATPQAAVGAIMRAKRVVVVGDPLQIEPVVTQSTRLIDKLGEFWLRGDRSRYSVDAHSVQTLADRSYAYGVPHPREKEAFIGIPLVMHRRCDNPMFDIANKIAYGNRMQHAKDGVITAHPVLGKSGWWHVPGATDGSKYVQAQGQRVLEALAALYRLAAAEGAAILPSVFVITPFREVKSGLVDLIESNDAWEQILAGSGLPTPVNRGAWAKTHVGTVHTFQGKESDIVFFVLGCDVERQAAVRWASDKPNLLNVAVTRAKKHAYIVGDVNLWGGKRHFSDAASAMDQYSGPLPRTSVPTHIPAPKLMRGQIS